MHLYVLLYIFRGFDLCSVLWTFKLISYSSFLSMEEIDEAYKDALTGAPSKRPLIEMTIPSVLDRTISPPGMTSL